MGNGITRRLQRQRSIVLRHRRSHIGIIGVGVQQLIVMVGADNGLEYCAGCAVTGQAEVHMIAVAGKAHAVVGPAGAQVLEHDARGDDSVESAFGDSTLSLSSDHGPHGVRVREGFGNVLGLGKVVVGLGQDIVEYGCIAALRLVGLELIHKAVYGRFLCACPPPG